MQLLSKYSWKKTSLLLIIPWFVNKIVQGLGFSAKFSFCQSANGALPGLPRILYKSPLFVGLNQRKYLVDKMWHYNFLQFCALDSVLRPRAIFIILKVSTSQTLNWFSILRKTLGVRCLQQIKTLLYWYIETYHLSMFMIRAGIEV